MEREKDKLKKQLEQRYRNKKQRWYVWEPKTVWFYYSINVIREKRWPSW